MAHHLLETRDENGDSWMLQRILENDDGATAIEYGLIAALVSISAIIALQSLGLSLVETFTTITDTLSGA
ncbi:Flp family type IVb pilin [Aurantiacibacter hainanensis]|uniref:Flp family type IVb pilin n=1 Tax=Aurantiacibacter hainanensis TaxID=3076114 RepID=UPI0030C676B3